MMVLVVDLSCESLGENYKKVRMSRRELAQRKYKRLRRRKCRFCHAFSTSLAQKMFCIFILNPPYLPIQVFLHR